MDDFDKQFNQTWRLAVVGIIGGWIVALAVLGFVIWAAIQVMQHFGVI